MNRISKKTYKFRVYCNKTTEKILCFILECCRWEYNLALSLKETAYKLTSTSPSKNEILKLISNFVTINPLLGKVYSHIRQDVIFRVDHSYKCFFKGLKAGRKVGKPKFQYDGKYNSFTFQDPKRGFKLSKKNKYGVKAKGNWRWLKLSLANREYIFLKVKYHRKVQGKIKTLTIKRNNLDQWFVTVVSEIKVPITPKNKAIGLDFGIKNLVHSSNNKTIENPMNIEVFKNVTERIANDQRQLQKVKNEKETSKGKEHKKWCIIYSKRLSFLRRSWNRYNNLKHDYLHKQSTKIVDSSYNFFCIEDFKPGALLKIEAGNAKSLRRNLKQASCTTFKNLLISKSLTSGKHHVLVPTYNTSKCCSSCLRLKEMPIENRIYKCKNSTCNMIMDRDLNAATNILRIGLNM